MARLHLADAHQADVGGHPRHAEDAQVVGQGRQGRIDLGQAVAVRGRVLLPAQHAHHDDKEHETEYHAAGADMDMSPGEQPDADPGTHIDEGERDFGGARIAEQKRGAEHQQGNGVGEQVIE